ncbi:MAG: K(+)-transporting ATPase subunit F [Dehalococcoidia bacterium]
MSVELWLGIVMALAGGAYLVAAFLWPERF